ncbi:MAG TPA: aldo/keto reductase [Planctomycetota bacterium]|nr:aldo/keto reductase [Planctomycetota bacterium]
MNRREFVQAVAGSVLAFGGLPAVAGEKAPAKPSATDRVTLGNTKVQITRLGLGTGTNGGRVQRELGQEGFTKLVRHAYDRGLRYIDTADNYKMHPFVKNAIQGLPREELVLQTKVWLNPTPDIPKCLDRFRQELATDYFDLVLLHCVMKATWPDDFKKHRDDLSAAKEKGIVRAVGVSTHGLTGLRTVAGCPWVEVALLRMNHDGAHMDGPTGRWAEPGSHAEAVVEIKKIRATGKGVIGMKLCGNGNFKDPDDREKAIQFVFRNKFADAVTIGFKSPAEVDEALDRITRALNA